MLEKRKNVPELLALQNSTSAKAPCPVLAICVKNKKEFYNWGILIPKGSSVSDAVIFVT